jgi:hypothetical protein
VEGVAGQVDKVSVAVKVVAEVHRRIPIICQGIPGRRTSTKNPLGLMKNYISVYIFLDTTVGKVSAGEW